MVQERIESGFFGESGIGLRAVESRIRIYSTTEIAGLVSNFSKRTGLRRSQFAINGWGFPFIPLPEAKTEYGNVRNAPRNVSLSFFGHPIYWIDPELTKRRPGEQEQEWCIRMFLLIDAMGYWNERAEFIDFLKVNEFSFDRAQIETYFNIAAQDNETDKYELLNEKYLDTSLENVDREYARVIQECFRMQEQESVNVLKQQAMQYKFAKKALGENVFKWSASFDEHGSVWHKKFKPALNTLAREYNKRLQENNPMTSDILRETRRIYDALVPFIIKYNHATSVLEIPVQIAIKGDPGGAARISLIASAMEIANQNDNVRKVILQDIDKEISSLQSGLVPNGFDHIIREMEKAYGGAWDRMRLAFVNYNRLRDGEEIFTTTIEMDAFFQAQQTDALGSVSSRRAYKESEGGGLSAILSEDFR